MGRKKENLLDIVPEKNAGISWHCDENGMVIVDMPNKGFFNAVAREFFGRPAVSHIELGDMGSFVWQCIDGSTSVYEIGKRVKERYGEAAEPLYERLAEYIRMLRAHKFIK